MREQLLGNLAIFAYLGTATEQAVFCDRNFLYSRLIRFSDSFPITLRVPGRIWKILTVASIIRVGAAPQAVWRFNRVLFGYAEKRQE